MGTENVLPQRLCVDVAAALSASVMVAPIITIIDRGIIQNASGAMKMKDSVLGGIKELFLRPHIFVRRPEFLMIWGLYAGTYTAANIINTGCEHTGRDSAIPRFLGTSLVNMTLCIAKDRAFTRMFGVTKPKPLPLPTYLIFTVRDGATIAASFNLPEPTSKALQQRTKLSAKSADVIAQLACPAAVQFLSTPLHLLGLDLYNRPNASAMERIAFIKSQYTAAVLARVGRIGPAFGIGGVGNTAFKATFRSALHC